MLLYISAHILSAVTIPYEMTILNRNRTRSICSTLLVLLIDLYLEDERGDFYLVSGSYNFAQVCDAQRLWILLFVQNSARFPDQVCAGG
jgi:hypothetical protein